MFCFKKSMESVQGKIVNNPQMKNPPLNVGVIDAPNAHYKPVLYSHAQASREFNALDKDLYQHIKKFEGKDDKKTPKSVIYTLGAAALAGLVLLLRKAFKK